MINAGAARKAAKAAPDAVVEPDPQVPELELGPEAPASGPAPAVLALVPSAAPVPSFEELGYVLPAEPEDRGSHRVTADPAPQDPEPPARQMITVYSAKGGVGTTFVAVNLAVLLAQEGKHRVCLVDLDLEFGDVAITSGLAPNRTIADLAALDELTEQAIDDVITPWLPGLDCVLTPVDPTLAERISPVLLAALLSQLRERYEYVVVDTPSQLNEHAVDALDAADRQVLVCTPDIPSLKNTRLVIDTLHLLGGDAGRRTVLLNRYDDEHGFGPAEVHEAIKHPVSVVLPYDLDVIKSIDSGVALATGKSDHRVVAPLGRLATEILTGEPVVTKRRSGLFGISSRKRFA